MERKRFYETEVDGCKAVVDTDLGVVHFDAVARNDALVPYVRPEEPYAPKVEIVLSRDPTVTTPYETLKRSQEIMRQRRQMETPRVKLTVGDISFATEQKKKRLEQHQASMESDLTVGDLSYATKQRNKDCQQRQDSVTRGLTVGDLSFASRNKDEYRPSVSPSEEIHASIVAKHNDKREEVRKMEELVFDIQQKKEAQEQAVADERRRLWGLGDYRGP